MGAFRVQGLVVSRFLAALDLEFGIFWVYGSVFRGFFGGCRSSRELNVQGGFGRFLMYA